MFGVSSERGGDDVSTVTVCCDGFVESGDIGHDEFAFFMDGGDLLGKGGAVLAGALCCINSHNVCTRVGDGPRRGNGGGDIDPGGAFFSQTNHGYVDFFSNSANVF